MAETKSYTLSEAGYDQFLKTNRYGAYHFAEVGNTTDVRNADGEKVGTATRNSFTGNITIETNDERAQRYFEAQNVEAKPVESMDEQVGKIFEGASQEDMQRFRDAMETIRGMPPKKRDQALDEMVKPTKSYTLSEADYGQFLKTNRYGAYHFAEVGNTTDVRNADGEKVGTATRNSFTGNITIETNDERAQRYFEAQNVEAKPVESMDEQVGKIFEGASQEDMQRFRDTVNDIRNMTPEDRSKFIDSMAESMAKISGKKKQKE